MTALLLHLRTAWNDYFPGSPVQIQSNEYTSRQTPSDTSVYVSNCLFKSITSTSGNGGALSCSSATYFLIELTSFFSCKTSSYGGAVSLHNGQFVLDGVCGYDCCSTGSGTHGQFVYIGAKNEISSKNYANYSSMARCINENSNSYYAFDLFGGKVCYSSANSSMNKCGYGVNYCYSFNDQYSVTGSLRYSSFVDNIASGYTCIRFYNTGSNYEIKSCNILRNTQVTLNSEGTIYTCGNLKIEDSCILDNTATYIFWVSSSSYTITLSNCTIDKTTKNGNVVTQSIVTKSFILALNHMSTLNCASEYDVVGTLTPIIQHPSSSKKKYCCTCGNFFHLPQFREVVSLISLLIFNFIYPYTSSDHLC
jgi:hypothetical protein